MSALGQRIRRVRKEAGMRSADVAVQVQKTPQYIRLIECGGALPSMQTTLAVCSLFPDEDSAEWLWLLLSDLWGPGVVTVMRAHAVAAPTAAPGATEGDG